MNEARLSLNWIKPGLTGGGGGEGAECVFSEINETFPS